jgi:hypothetical protein
MPGLSDQEKLGLGISILFAALVRTLGESDKAIPEKFLRELDAHYGRLEHWGTEAELPRKVVSWTRDRVAGL